MIEELLVLAIVLILTTVLIRTFWPDTDVNLDSLGRWAVVTGSTDGIGKAFAHEVAKKGFNVLLVSRSLEKLEANSNEIREKYGVSTKVFQVDFSEVNKSVNVALKEQLQKLDVGLLINNVGTTTPHPEYFLKLEENHEEVFEHIININVISTITMTRYVLPGMLKAKKGLIINVSSQLSESPSPMHALYGGTKAFVTKFSKDLDLETRGTGVHVHVLNTGLVATKLSGASVSDWFPQAVSPEDYAKSALAEATKWRVATGHIVHTIPVTLARILPHWLEEKLFYQAMRSRRSHLIKNCAKCSQQN